MSTRQPDATEGSDCDDRARRRVQAAIAQCEGDRIPIDYWAHADVTKRLKRYFFSSAPDASVVAERQTPAMLRSAISVAAARTKKTDDDLSSIFETIPIQPTRGLARSDLPRRFRAAVRNRVPSGPLGFDESNQRVDGCERLAANLFVLDLNAEFLFQPDDKFQRVDGIETKARSEQGGSQ